MYIVVSGIRMPDLVATSSHNKYNHGIPFVSEVFFFRESYEWSILKIMLHIVGWQKK